MAAPETLVGSDLLAFAGIAPVRFPVYPLTQHLAEKRKKKTTTTRNKR